MNKLFKRCPRCNTKQNIESAKCPACGLIFDRLKNVTNRAGKQALNSGEKKKVIYVKTPPIDVNKWKLLILDIFFGFFGVPFFMVGRKKVGFLFLVSLFLFVASTALSYFGILPEYIEEDPYIGVLLYFLLIPEAICAVMWLSSVIAIAFNKFKYPVSIDEDYAVENVSSPMAQDILKSVKKERENKREENG